MLKDKIILVTGASRGIGQATAITLAKKGAQVILHGRTEESLQKTVALIRETRCEPYIVLYDVTDEVGMKQAIKDIKLQFGRLDGLVNNAGVMDEGLLGMVKTEKIQNMLSVNVTAVLQQMQYSAKLMTKNDSSAIVNISSIIGMNGAAGSAAYSASKAAVVGLTKSAAKEWAPKNIRVNAVAPGFIETDLTAHYEGERKEKVLNDIKMRRFGQVEEVANVISFLLSDLSSYVTGQVIGVDGGMVI
ncbi:glucose 1-dehydrogenase [Lysinibacillus sp. 1 U-2021]|uniref:SDR family NAD(P)-dependent oxidoreductase n=1 Tax=Lysinibacillus sp. 1 U-2021 TaxID=3039426 RepID=UPI002480B282|nr:glucose 1-dehydrogenase [Lysinibacillus sp. 1 U-2021]WGT40592.1 glucose 1-dehydrogenase [Lysinibacillus sp. 1 U-2021]